jgi:hypothetical protein
MSVLSISPGTPGPAGASLFPRQRAVGGDGTAPALTVPLDIALTSESLTPQAFRLLELVRELVDQGDGAVTVSGSAGRRPTQPCHVRR